MWIKVNIPAASCGAFKNLRPTAPTVHFWGSSDTVYTDEWSQTSLGLLWNEQNIHLPRILLPTVSVAPMDIGQISLWQRYSSWFASPGLASIAAVQREIHAHDPPLLPSYRFPYHTLPPHFELFLALPPLPRRSIVPFGISASIQNDISGHRPNAHSLLLPSLYSISPSGCTLSSPQQAVGYSANSFINISSG